jgi:UPF0755 protein
MFGVASWFYAYVNQPGPSATQSEVVVDIPRGASLREIAILLEQRGVIRNDVRFLILAKISGYATKLQAGEFLLATAQVPLVALQTVATGKVVQHVVTIPEGLRATEIAELFAEDGWCPAQEFLARVEDPELIAQLGLSGISSLEGFLYPDTYMLTRESRDAGTIVAMMVSRFQQVWKELLEARNDDPELLPTVILASMVEKETGAASERPLIAGVFVNRLRLGMRLQSDPTVVYGIDNFEYPITRKDLKTSHPYNTYTVPGLPAGPIANPGRAALLAVLEPAETDAIYFVARNDGTHHFSTSLSEHNRAVQKYQRKNRAKKGK